MPKSKILNIRVEPELKKRARELADAEGRSLSNWVTYLIQREIKKARKPRKK
ncbi:MAG: YlcI/YnfO family protein [Pseudomonadota bacterium]